MTQPLHQFVETFDQLAGSRWEFNAENARIVDGQLDVTAAFRDPADAETVLFRSAGEVWSRHPFDLRDDAWTAQLLRHNELASGVVELGVFGGDSPRTRSLLWRLRADPLSPWGFVLEAVARLDPDPAKPVVVATLRPDPQEYQWLRILVDGMTVIWQTSPDGLTWNTAGQLANVPLTFLSSVRLFFGNRFGSPGETTTGLTARFDSLNVVLGVNDPATVTGADGDPFLAVDVLPNFRTGAFTVGLSKLGGPDRLTWSGDDPELWVNVVCNVRRVNYRRGASRELGVLTRAEAGAGVITVEDVAGQFDPNMNSRAIRKGTPARLRAWGYRTDGSRWDAVLFTGELDDVGVQYAPEDEAPLVALELVDLVGPLTAWESEGEPAPGVGAGESLLQRARRLLGIADRGEVSSASSAAFTATLAPTQLMQPWNELLDAQEAELGRMWVDRHNRVVVQSRGSRPAGRIRGTLSDVHGSAPLGVHCCIADADVRHGSEGLTNRVLASRRPLEGQTEPAVVRRDDALSQRLYGVATVNRTQQLELQTDAQVPGWAGALITARTRPELRVDSVAPRPSPGDLDSALDAWPAVLQTDLGDRWLFDFHPKRGPAITRGVGVVGIVVEVTPDGWSVTWTTEDAPVPGAENPTGWFVVGVSKVGSGDLVAPYSSPAPLAG